MNDSRTKSYLFPIGRSSEHVHFLLFREWLETAGERDRVQDCHAAGKRIISWLQNLTNHIKDQTMHLSDNYSHLRVRKGFLNAALICSCNCIGVKPVALISPISGSVVIPSGRTGTTFDISGSFHTLMLRTSSTPVTKLSGCTSATRGGVVSGAAGCPDLAGSVESGNAGLATLAEFVEFCPDRRTQPTAQQNQQCQHKNCTISQVPFLRMHLPTFVKNYSALSSSSRLLPELERRWGIPTSLSLYSNAR